MTETTEETPFQYRVRLVMRVDSIEGQPETAVYEFIDLLTANGLRTWAYVVEDLESGRIVGYYDGYGSEMQLVDDGSGLLGEVENSSSGDSPTEDEEDVQPIEDLELPVESPNDDASLEALAQSLNEETQG